MVSVMIIILFTGLMLPSPDSHDTFGLLVGGFFLLITAAALPLFFWKEEHSPERIYIFISCIMLLSAVQITGGGINSPLFAVYFLFLMWVSLPSVKGPTVALGLGMGLIEGIAPISRLISEREPLFADAGIYINFTIVFISLFGFGLLANWLTKTDFSFLPERGRITGATKQRQKTDFVFPTSTASHFLPMIQRNSASAATCLFVRYDDHSYQLAASAGSKEEIIPKYILPVDDSIVKQLLNVKRSCLIDMRDNGTNSFAAVYRNRRRKKICRIAVTPVISSGEMYGFFLQDFLTGEEPDKTTFTDLEDAAATCLSIMSGKSEITGDVSISAWTEDLVEIVSRSTAQTLVTDILQHLTGFLKGITVSILETDFSKGVMYVWARKGPLTKGKRRENFKIDDGVAGWCVRNASPCTRLHMKQGKKKAYSFTRTEDLFDEVNSCFAVPLMNNGSVVGLVMAEHNDDDYFSPEHNHLIKIAAGMLSLGLNYASLKTHQENIRGKDTLTGLPGAARLHDYLGNLIKQVRHSGSYIGLLIADIDNFTLLNLQYGYREGDRILLEASKRFRSCLNEDIFIAKVGPDSFAACIPGAEKHTLEALASRIAGHLTWEHQTLSDDLCTVSVSIGASFTHTDRKVLTLIAESEKAVEKAVELPDSPYYIFFVRGYGPTLLKDDTH